MLANLYNCTTNGTVTIINAFEPIIIVLYCVMGVANYYIAV